MRLVEAIIRRGVGGVNGGCLRWQDLNLEKGLLSIRQTLICVTTGILEFKTPKTRSGRRSMLDGTL